MVPRDCLLEHVVFSCVRFLPSLLLDEMDYGNGDLRNAEKREHNCRNRSVFCDSTEEQNEKQNMLHFLPDNWYSVLVTALFGILAYLAISWIRLSQERRTGKTDQNSSIRDVVKSDVTQIVEEIKKAAKRGNSSDKHLRRGSSSDHLSSNEKDTRPVLKRQSSACGMQMRLSLSYCPL